MSDTTRRKFLKDAALAGAAITTSTMAESSLLAAPSRTRISGAAPPAATQQNVKLFWLDGNAPLVGSGISWGVPWARGTVAPAAAFSFSVQGKDLPLQSWPLAFWPDGSLKWSGFATVVQAGVEGPLSLETLPPGASAGSTLGE